MWESKQGELELRLPGEIETLSVSIIPVLRRCTKR